MAWIAVSVLVLPLSGHADTFHPLYSFAAAENGIYPGGTLIWARDGTFYGMTNNGGLYNQGTIFQLKPDGTLTTLYTFRHSPAAVGNPGQAGLMQASDGSLYGAAAAGGANGTGMVFQITTKGAFTVLYSFSALQNRRFNTDGAVPYSTLVQTADGNLYGTTSAGGANGTGTAFRITTAGKFTLLHTFSAISANNTDGAAPGAGLIQARDGYLYGTTFYGGIHNQGTVFRITTSGVLISLYSFYKVADGVNPGASLIQARDGNLYGTTANTIFRITTAGKLTTLHNLNGTEGVFPFSALLQARNGNFYGTTALGGAYGYSSQLVASYGTLFRITPAGQFTLLHNFTAPDTDGINTDGDSPNGALIQASDGKLYGTTQMGGNYGLGTIFTVDIAP